MAATSILGGINQELTQQELLTQVTLLLFSILEKMPRVDANDRLVINASEIATPMTMNSGTLTALLSFGALARPTDAMPVQASNAGAMHIYDNIKVS